MRLLSVFFFCSGNYLLCRQEDLYSLIEPRVDVSPEELLEGKCESDQLILVLFSVNMDSVVFQVSFVWPSVRPSR